MRTEICNTCMIDKICDHNENFKSKVFGEKLCNLYVSEDDMGKKRKENGASCKNCLNNHLCDYKSDAFGETVCNLYMEDGQLAKKDKGKIEPMLVPPEIIRCIAKVRMWAIENKYPDKDNWRSVSLERYYNALIRHTLLFMENPDGIDEETALPHYYHMATNLAFICEMKKGVRDE